MKTKQEIVDELKKKINDIENGSMIPFMSFEQGAYSAHNKDLKLIEQLAEPQKVSWRKAISVLEHHFQCEIPRNLNQVVEGFRDMSSIMNTVEFELSKINSELTAKEFIFEALESKKQKVKVPAFVAEYIVWCHSEGLTLWEVFKTIRGMPEKVWEWLKDEGHQAVFSKAYTDGYEVEEEPKYIVPVPNLSKEFFYTADGQHISFCQRRNIDDVKSKVKFTLKEVERLFPELVDTVEKVEA